MPVIDGEMMQERPEKGGNENGMGEGGGDGWVFEVSKGKTQPTDYPSYSLLFTILLGAMEGSS